MKCRWNVNRSMFYLIYRRHRIYLISTNLIPTFLTDSFMMPTFMTNRPILAWRSRWHWLHRNVGGERVGFCRNVLTFRLASSFFFSGGVLVLASDGDRTSRVGTVLCMCFKRFSLRFNDFHWHFELLLFYFSVGNPVVISLKYAHWII